MAKNRARQQLLSAVVVALLGSSALMPTNAQADPSLQVLGSTIGEWSAKWWKWAQSIPLSSSPLTDTDGRYCGEGQKGPVWFLGGSWGPLVGQSVSRSCHVPADKSILFPIFTSIWVNTTLDDPNNSKADMRACVAGLPNTVVGCGTIGSEQVAGGLTATLSLESGPQNRPVIFHTPIVRSQSPFFKLGKYPDDSIWSIYGVPSSIFENGPSVSDGFWVMLPPLKPGTYVLRFSATAAGPALQQDLTYRLVVGK
jgi:hypothetical protein